MNLNLIKKSYIEGVYADTPQNRKLGRVGMTYAAYNKRLEQHGPQKEEFKNEGKRLNQLIKGTYIKVKNNHGHEYLIKNSNDWCYLTKDGVATDKQGHILFWRTQTAANQMGPSFAHDFLPLSNLEGKNELVSIKKQETIPSNFDNKKAIVKMMESTLKKQLGFDFELTIRDTNNWTLSYEGRHDDYVEKVSKFFNSGKYSSNITSDYDDELDETYVYVELGKKE